MARWFHRRGLTLVWRMQNAVGKGPYRWEALEPFHPNIDEFYRQYGMPCYDAWATTNHERCPFHPTPMEDGIDLHYITRGERYLFGFNDLRQAYNWFNAEERGYLEAIGFKLVQREASYIIPGARQIAFLPADEL